MDYNNNYYLHKRKNYTNWKKERKKEIPIIKILLDSKYLYNHGDHQTVSFSKVLDGMNQSIDRSIDQIIYYYHHHYRYHMVFP